MCGCSAKKKVREVKMTTKKILLVDDSITVLLVEKKILSNNGFELITARDGQEAVTMAEAERPDLILLDLVMPKMNGFEACVELRHMESTCSIPIIMVTTRGEEQNIVTGYESGCNDYITKPINNVELLAKIRNLLQLN
jgi:DNA-binding response OmpR family regulator